MVEWHGSLWTCYGMGAQKSIHAGNGWDEIQKISRFFLRIVCLSSLFFKCVAKIDFNVDFTHKLCAALMFHPLRFLLYLKYDLFLDVYQVYILGKVLFYLPFLFVETPLRLLYVNRDAGVGSPLSLVIGRSRPSFFFFFLNAQGNEIDISVFLDYWGGMRNGMGLYCYYLFSEMYLFLQRKWETENDDCWICILWQPMR